MALTSADTMIRLIRRGIALVCLLTLVLPLTGCAGTVLGLSGDALSAYRDAKRNPTDDAIADAYKQILDVLKQYPPTIDPEVDPSHAFRNMQAELLAAKNDLETNYGDVLARAFRGTPTQHTPTPVTPVTPPPPPPGPNNPAFLGPSTLPPNTTINPATTTPPIPQ